MVKLIADPRHFHARELGAVPGRSGVDVQYGERVATSRIGI
jgi:hypothetical protein